MFMIETVDEIRNFYQLTAGAQSSYLLSQWRGLCAKPNKHMELLILCVIGLLIAIFVLPFVAIAKANSVTRSLNDLLNRLSSLENDLRNLRRQTAVEPKAVAPPPTVEAAPPPLPVTAPAPVRQRKNRSQRQLREGSSLPDVSQSAMPPPKPPIDWEQFMGAKLFAWIGGLALFLGVAFFVKYSFEHNLVPPELRVAIGFVVGVALLVGGVLLKRKENAVTAQTLCATGVLVLYAVTFACRSYYHFAFFGLVPTFLLMVLITAVAFLLAVRLNAMLVAVLGIAGGFLTPVLLSTGQDHPLGLFVYIALLDVGLLAVAQRQRWHALSILGAIGTVLTQLSWIGTFFVPEKYFAGNRVLVVMAVLSGFQALFLAAVGWAKRTGKINHELLACALGLAAVAMFSSFYLVSFQTIAHRPAPLFSYVFLVDLGLLLLTLLETRVIIVAALAGLAVFIFLGRGRPLSDHGNIYIALAFYFLFALFHSAAPFALQRLRKIHIPWWSTHFPHSRFCWCHADFPAQRTFNSVWPFVLIVDLLAIVLAATTATSCQFSLCSCLRW